MEDLNPSDLERPKRVRRTHSKAFKAQLVALAEAGDMSVAQIAMDNRINANQLRKWMKESGSAPAAQSMVPVSVADTRVAPLFEDTGTVVMELNLNDSAIRIHQNWDPLAVAKLIKALR